MESNAEDIIQEMVITVYSQAHFAQVFDGRQLPFPVQNIADGKVFAVTSFADLADGGTYKGSSERLMSRASSAFYVKIQT